MLRLYLLMVLFFCLEKSFAQLCQGSLGDPIVNISFGKGANPGPPLTAATTNYSYTSGDCPNDGSYTVRNNTSTCFGSTWHSLSSDHTGDANGYFMLVNASIQPSAFYVDTVRGLCGNTTYEFAAWVLNVLKSSSCSGNGIQPNLSFMIERTDGSLLQQYNSGNIPGLSSPQWQQFGFFFSTPNNVSDIVLRIVNNASGGCGNDLALDDITFRPCGAKLTPTVNGSDSLTRNTCEGQAAMFNFDCTVSAGYSNPSFQWQKSSDGVVWADIAGATNTSYNISLAASTPPSVFYYRLTAAESGNINSFRCRVSSPPLSIRVVAKPVLSLSSNSPVCEKKDIALSASGTLQYLWTGPSNFSSINANPVINNVSVSNQGWYYLQGTNAEGCSKTDSIRIVVNASPSVIAWASKDSICEGSSVQLTASGANTYQWLPAGAVLSPNSAVTSASPSASTNYVLIGTNTLGCTDTAFVKISVLKKPVANAGPDISIAEGQSGQLHATASGTGIRYSWVPAPGLSDINNLDPFVNPSSDATYFFTVNSNYGCGTSSDTVNVRVLKKVIIPNAFTPNGDGINDTWEIPALLVYSNYDLSVFNRYGLKVYQTVMYGKAWDGKRNGKELPYGTYYFILTIKDIDQKFSGSVTIIR